MRLFVWLALAGCLFAQEAQKKKKAPVAGDDRQGYTDTPQIPGQPWKVHDAARPRPRKVAPAATTGNPPADGTERHGPPAGDTLCRAQ